MLFKSPDILYLQLYFHRTNDIPYNFYNLIAITTSEKSPQCDIASTVQWHSLF